MKNIPMPPTDKNEQASGYFTTSVMSLRQHFGKISVLLVGLKIVTVVIFLSVYYSSSNDETHDAAKLILAWTGSKGVNLKRRWLSAQKFCDEKRCSVSNDREDLAKSTAVMFNLPHLNASDVPIRKMEQQFILYSHESPQIFVKSLPPKFFTWSMTYRNPSDIGHPFGTYLSNKTSLFGGELKPKFNWNATVEIVRRKTKMIAWFVSNCHTHSKREDYVTRLSKYVQVDIFGKCGNQTCDSSCMQRSLSSDYLFFIAFENSVCKDYITEKMWRLKELSVPIVFRHKEAEAVAPKQSFIAADSFATPRELATFLQRLAANRTEYLKYFKWRKLHWIPSATATQHDAFCRLCKELNSPVKRKMQFVDMISWWSGEGRCLKNFAHTLF